MSNWYILLIGVLITYIVLLGITTKKQGSVKKAIKVLNKEGATKGILMAGAVTLILSLLLILIYKPANAAPLDLSYFERTTVYAGLDVDVNHKNFCYSGGTNDRLTSNLGVRQHLISVNDIEFLGTYTHHSCALNRDKPTYDAVGLSIEWTFKR